MKNIKEIISIIIGLLFIVASIKIIYSLREGGDGEINPPSTPDSYLNCSVCNDIIYDNYDGKCLYPFETNITDPDCRVTIKGKLNYSEGSEITYTNIKVKAYPLRTGLGTISTIVTPEGEFNLNILIQKNASPSDYIIVAYGNGFDSKAYRIKPGEIMPPSTINISLTLYNSSCSPDCSNYEGICSMSCIHYSSQSGRCNKIIDQCLGKRPGEYVFIGYDNAQDPQNAIYQECCSGENEMLLPVSSANIEGDIKHMVKHEITSRLGDMPIKVNIVTWE